MPYGSAQAFYPGSKPVKVAFVDACSESTTLSASLLRCVKRGVLPDHPKIKTYHGHNNTAQRGYRRGSLNMPQERGPSPHAADGTFAVRVLRGGLTGDESGLQCGPPWCWSRPMSKERAAEAFPSSWSFPLVRSRTFAEFSIESISREPMTGLDGWIPFFRRENDPAIHSKSNANSPAGLFCLLTPPGARHREVAWS